MRIDPKAIQKAKSRIRVATKAVGELASCKTPEEFSDTWYIFLVAAKNVYTAIEQGAKTSPQNKQWFGLKKADRKSDELLQYLFQARDDDEHGIEQVTEFVPGSLAIGVSKPGFSQAIQVRGTIGPGGTLSVQSLDGNPVLIKETHPHMQLATVTARGGIKYSPPRVHLGKKIADNSPKFVAGLALSYLSDLVKEAEERA